jgi:polyisoprenoid-binding protein YceI
MMRRRAILISTLALAAQFASAQTSTWISDANHSEVDFAITHMSISKVHGRFGGVAATIQYDESDITKSSVQVNIDVSSVDTGVQARDAALKGANYFDVEAFPKATFVSTSVTRSGSQLTVDGNLTLRGITRPIVLEVDGPTPPVTDGRNKVHRGFSATTTISRSTFGIAPNTPAAMLSDDVNLTIEVDAVKQ